MSMSSRFGRSLTAEDGRCQVFHTGDGGRQTSHNADNAVVEGGVGGHSQDGGLAAGHLPALHHHPETQAEEVGPPQGGHHPAAQEPGDRNQAAVSTSIRKVIRKNWQLCRGLIKLTNIWIIRP